MSLGKSKCEPARSALDDLREAIHQFESEGLPFPPVPTALRASVRSLSPWVYGTRSDARGLYELAWFVEEAEHGRAAPYVMLGHAGYGFNSWAIHFYVVQPPLALFIQSQWGNAFADRDEATRELTARFALAATLMEAAQQARQAGALPPSARLFVVVSDFYGSRWKKVMDDEEAAAIPWNESATALEDALDWIHAAQRN